MKPHHFLVLAALMALPEALHAQTVTSGVPNFINYRGRVLNSSGGLVGTGTPVNRKVTFRVWDHASSTLDANLIYSEEQTVTIADGDFSVLVGQGVATTGTQFTYSETGKGPPTQITDAFISSSRYLGVTVDDGTAAADNEITPRQQIVSSAFAFRAKFAERLGTSSSTTPALTVIDGGKIGVGNTNPPALFTISGANTTTTTSTPQLLVTADDISERLRIGVDSTGNGSGFLQSWKEGTGATNLLVNPTGGNVGIGTTTPAYKLHVEGSMYSTTLDTGLSNIGTARFRGVNREANIGGCYIQWGNQSPGTFGQSYILNHQEGGVPGIFLGEINTARTISPSLFTSPSTTAIYGNLGVGTTSPDAKLTVTRTDNNIDAVRFHATATGPNVSHVFNGGNGDIYWRSASSAGKVILQDTGGNVGIGTNAPTAQLQVGPNPAAGYGNTFAWASSLFQSNGGEIGGAAGATKNMGAFTATCGNIASLTMKAYRNAPGGWQNVAVGLGYDIDTFANIGGSLWFYNGNVGVATTAPVYKLHLGNGNAGKPGGGTWADSSDQRIKRNIAPLANAVAQLSKLRGVSFEWINPADHADQTGRQAGFIAQEVAKAFPKWVASVDAAEHDRTLTDDGKIFSMSLPFEFDALVVEAIKEQQLAAAAKDARIAELEKQLALRDAADQVRDSRLAAIESAMERASRPTAQKITVKQGE